MNKRRALHQNMRMENRAVIGFNLFNPQRTYSHRRVR
jgi:hypothetical protein